MSRMLDSKRWFGSVTACTPPVDAVGRSGGLSIRADSTIKSLIEGLLDALTADNVGIGGNTVHRRIVHGVRA
jgi:hypothetical protein